MKAHLVKNAIRQYKRDNQNGAILTKLSGIITNYFSSLIANLEDFIASFDDEDELTAEQQCELLRIMVESGAFSPGWWYRSFHGLVYETWIYPQFKSSLGDADSTLINVATCLASADLLTAVNMEQAARQSKNQWGGLPDVALKHLSNANLVSQANIDLVMTSSSASTVAEICVLLHRHELLDAFRNKIRNDPFHPDKLWKILRILAEHHLLTNENAHNSFQYNHFFTIDLTDVLYMIHSHFVTQKRIDDVFAICAKPNITKEIAADEVHELCKPYQRVIYYGNNAQTPALSLLFNPQQSTHTASVHRTVSLSASRLMQRYHDKVINPEVQLLAMQDALVQFAGPSLLSDLYDQLIYLTANVRQAKTNWQILVSIWSVVNMLGHWPLIPLEYPQINLARRALQHILKSQTRHIDPVSQVSTMQLLALVWEAIHDDEHRQGDLHAVRGRLVQCLSEVPKDAECKSYICAGGIFNKIMESLDKLHPDVEILYITHDSIVLKYNIVVNEAVSNYLIELLERAPEPSTAAYVLRLLRDKESHTPAEILAAIRTEVADRFWSEFDSHYHSKNDPRFIGLLNLMGMVSFEDKQGIEDRAEVILNRSTVRLAL